MHDFPLSCSKTVLVSLFLQNNKNIPSTDPQTDLKKELMFIICTNLILSDKAQIDD